MFWSFGIFILVFAVLYRETSGNPVLHILEYSSTIFGYYVNIEKCFNYFTFNPDHVSIDLHAIPQNKCLLKLASHCDPE
jgi:hypothetical protein